MVMKAFETYLRRLPQRSADIDPNIFCTTTLKYRGQPRLLLIFETISSRNCGGLTVSGTWYPLQRFEPLFHQGPAAGWVQRMCCLQSSSHFCGFLVLLRRGWRRFGEK